MMKNHHPEKYFDNLVLRIGLSEEDVLVTYMCQNGEILSETM